MNMRQKKIVEKVVKEVLKNFPDVVYDGIWEKGDGSLGIRIITYEDNGFDISEAITPMLMEVFEEEGYDIFVMPLERVGKKNGSYNFFDLTRTSAPDLDLSE
jgi:hypothetical protein